MGWKDWSYWLKGGIIGLIISTIVIVIALLQLINYAIIKWPLLILINLFANQYVAISQCSGDSCIGFLFFVPLLVFIEFFVIGAIIGWIYGKIKQRKEDS